MGAINYKTSDYITIGYNCNTEYARDDFWKDEEEQRVFEISFLYDEVAATLEKYDFQFYHVTICPGYYEGFTIDIENNFAVVENRKSLARSDFKHRPLFESEHRPARN